MSPVPQSFMQRMVSSNPSMRTGGAASQQRVTRSPNLLQMMELAQRQRQQGGVKPQPKADYDTSDPFEVMQRDTRKGEYQDVFDAGYEGAGSGNFYRADESGEMPQYLKDSLAKYGPRGLQAQYYEAGQDPYDNSLGAGWRTTSDLAKLEASMPKGPSNTSFRDLRPLTSDDKNNVKNPSMVGYDPNYGWVTHRKNFDQNADKSWFMRNAHMIMPALFTGGLGLAGVPASVLAATSLGRGAVDAIGGNKDWKSLLPQLLAAGLPMIPGFSQLGNLARMGIRTGGNFAINNLINRGRKG